MARGTSHSSLKTFGGRRGDKATLYPWISSSTPTSGRGAVSLSLVLELCIDFFLCVYVLMLDLFRFYAYRMPISCPFVCFCFSICPSFFGCNYAYFFFVCVYLICLALMYEYTVMKRSAALCYAFFIYLSTYLFICLPVHLIQHVYPQVSLGGGARRVVLFPRRRLPKTRPR